MSLVNPKVNLRSCSGNIYIADAKKGLYIKIYNKNGEKIGTINNAFQKIKINETYQKKIKEDFMNSRGARRFRTHFKNRKFSFPDFFPAIDDFFVSHGKIYIKTYKLKDGKYEYLILNLKGNLINSVFLPGADDNLYIIENGVYYYLSENEKLEVWEIHAINIE